MPKSTPEATAPSGIPPVGGHQLVGDRRLFVDRAGTGGPSIVFLPGAGTVGLDYHLLHQHAARHSTSILYDRAGTGWSDAVPLPRSAGAVVNELRDLLRAIGAPAPYLLVGHSLGGGYARHYAQRFPTDVAGLLLLDPLHEDSPSYFPREITEMQERMKDQPVVDLPAALIEVYRKVFEEKLAAWPASLREPLIGYHLAAWRVGMVEGSNVNTLYDEFRQGGVLPGVPVIVMTAMGLDAAQSMFMPEPLQRAVNDGKRLLNLALTATCSRGEHRELPTAAHAWMHHDDHTAIARAIDDLVARA